MNGKEIDLTAENVSIASTKLNIDKYGNINMFDTGDDTTVHASIFINNTSISDDAMFLQSNQLLFGTGNKSSLLTKENLIIADSSSNIMSILENKTFRIIGNNAAIIAALDDSTPNDTSIYVSNTQQDILTIIKPNVIYTPVLYQTSQKENKKNFEKVEKAIDLLKKIEIYKYNMKYENDGDKKHIGFVIGDDFNYIKEVTSADDKNVDIYSFISLCCKAIQEQQEQIEDLQKQINELKGEK